MLTVHHLRISQSERIVWLCEELEIPYTLKLYDRDPVTRLAPAEYKALHKLQTAPVISDGDVVLAETSAVMEYILARYGKGRLVVGPGAANFADYLFWFHFANGSLVPAAMVDMISMMLASQVDVGLLDALRQRGNNGFAIVEDRLGKVPFFAGEEFTAADIIMGFSLTTMRAFAPRDLSAYPNILAYNARIGERAAYRRAMEKAEPGMTPMLS